MDLSFDKGSPRKTDEAVKEQEKSTAVKIFRFRVLSGSFFLDGKSVLRKLAKAKENRGYLDATSHHIGVTMRLRKITFSSQIGHADVLAFRHFRLYPIYT